MNVNEAEKNFATETMGAKAALDNRRGPGWHSYFYPSDAGKVCVWACARGWAVALLCKVTNRFVGHTYRDDLDGALEAARTKAGMLPAIHYRLDVVNKGRGEEVKYSQRFYGLEAAREQFDRVWQLSYCVSCTLWVVSPDGETPYAVHNSSDEVSA